MNILFTLAAILWTVNAILQTLNFNKSALISIWWLVFLSWILAFEVLK